MMAGRIPWEKMAGFIQSYAKSYAWQPRKNEAMQGAAAPLAKLAATRKRFEVRSLKTYLASTIQTAFSSDETVWARGLHSTKPLR